MSFDKSMDTRKTPPAPEILACQNCGGKTMSVATQEKEFAVQCASCNDLVAYTQELIRVLRDSSQAT